jgi:hypothetical protein
VHRPQVEPAAMLHRPTPTAITGGRMAQGKPRSPPASRSVAGTPLSRPPPYRHALYDAGALGKVAVLHRTAAQEAAAVVHRSGFGPIANLPWHVHRPHGRPFRFVCRSARRHDDATPAGIRWLSWRTASASECRAGPVAELRPPGGGPAGLGCRASLGTRRCRVTV